MERIIYRRAAGRCAVRLWCQEVGDAHAASEKAPRSLMRRLINWSEMVYQDIVQPIQIALHHNAEGCLLETRHRRTDRLVWMPLKQRSLPVHRGEDDGHL